MENKQKNKSLFDYIFEYAGEYKAQYIKSLVLALIGVAFSLVPFIIMGYMVKILLNGERDFKVFLFYGILTAVAWILRILFHTFSTNTSHKATFKLIGIVRTRLIDKLARLPLGTVLEIPSGSLKNIIMERVDSIETTLAHIIPEFTSNLAAPFMMFVYLMVIDWRMALLSLSTLPIALICMIVMAVNNEKPFKKTQETTKALNDTAVEYINGIEVIKAFGKAESSYQRFADAAKANADSFIDWMKACIVPFAGAMVIAPSTLLAILPVGALFVMHGTLALADYVNVLILGMGLITPLITVMGYNDDVNKATAIFGEIDALVNLSELERPTVSKELPTKADIVLDDVHFAYSEKEILHGVNLNIPEGSVTAIVGHSGSGKSTIARLIASLWDVTSGSIRIGGVDIKNISMEDYNANVAYVSQNNFLFDTTIRENIRMGRKDATDSEVEDIAKRSGCYDFIMGLENGFETVVGGSGAHISGGERQRIAIARAMMKNAPILILDEATAYTDPENEALIQRSIAELAQGKTLIVIAHRLSTIVDSDQIAVVDSGRVIDTGKHEELLARCEIYKNMWTAHISSKDSIGGDKE